MPKVKVTTSKGLVQETGSGPTALDSGASIGAQAIAATGANINNCTQIVSSDGGLVLVSGADGTKAVKLPALADVPAGTMFYILNLNGSNALEVFPGVAGDQIHPAADGAAITVAADGMLICVADAAGVLWASAEPAATAA